VPKRQTSSPAVREQLRQVPGFDKLPETTLARIESLSTEMSVAAGAVLTTQGEPGRQAFIVLEGNAAVRRDGEVLAVVSAGALIGETALLDGGPRTADVIAVSPLRVLVVNPAEFATLYDDLGFSHWITSQLAKRTR
jgi:CRP-like cAMP-binding protein